MSDYRGLKVWREAHELVLALYRITATFPNDERFGIIRQLRRSAASIPANLAEGMGKRGDKERARYTNIALGSAGEVDYHLLLSRDLGYLDEADYSRLSGRISSVRMLLQGLHRRLRGEKKNSPIR